MLITLTWTDLNGNILKTVLKYLFIQIFYKSIMCVCGHVCRALCVLYVTRYNSAEKLPSEAGSKQQSLYL